MFSYEERIKAVKLLLQYDISYSTVIRELGYPTKETLWNWYNEYSQNGDLHQNFIKQTKFKYPIQKICVKMQLMWVDGAMEKFKQVFHTVDIIDNKKIRVNGKIINLKGLKKQLLGQSGDINLSEDDVTGRIGEE